jgi:small-conductance mechanosensitive channel
VPNEINLQVLKRFNEAGLEFAFPTQTLYHEGLPKT